ncbi:MAG: phospholipase D family protein [Ahniella sp.]|nr:phospholipase D family protein [Ahniella sp.]
MSAYLSLAARQRLSLILVVMVALGQSACTGRHALYRSAEQVARASQVHDIRCAPPEHCAQPSDWQRDADALAISAEGTAGTHELTLLEDGTDALAARIHLIRSARESIALQPFIFEPDETGKLVLRELMAAAERGVRVQILLDQLFSLDSRKLLARLAMSRTNFEVRVYNPTFNEAQTAPLEFAAGIVCCFKRFNQRSHNKLFLIDDRIAILGGRNISNHYFDLAEDFNYHDRDVVIVGPETLPMRASFEQFWAHERTRSMWQLNDVAQRLVDGMPDGPLTAEDFEVGERLQRFVTLADDPEWLARLRATRVEAARVSYFSDPPDKPFVTLVARRDLSQRMVELIASADTELLLQTPYMLLSRPARKTFLQMAKDKPDLRRRVSSNSLAATDAWPVYALAHKHRRFYLEDLGFELHEFKPYQVLRCGAESQTAELREELAEHREPAGPAVEPDHSPAQPAFQINRDRSRNRHRRLAQLRSALDLAEYRERHHRLGPSIRRSACCRDRT